MPLYDPAGCAGLAFGEPIASNRAMTGPARSCSESLAVLRARLSVVGARRRDADTVRINGAWRRH